MRIKIIHKEMSEKECLENVKRLHKMNPEIFMSLREYEELKKRLK